MFVTCVDGERQVCIEVAATALVCNVVARLANAFAWQQWAAAAHGQVDGLPAPAAALAKELVDLVCVAWRLSPVDEARIEELFSAIEREAMPGQLAPRTTSASDTLTLWWARKPLARDEEIGKRSAYNERTRIKAVLAPLDAPSAPVAAAVEPTAAGAVSSAAAASPEQGSLSSLLDKRLQSGPEGVKRRAIEPLPLEHVTAEQLAKLERDTEVLRLLQSPSLKADLARICRADDPRAELTRLMALSKDLRVFGDVALLAVGAAKLVNGRVEFCG